MSYEKAKARSFISGFEKSDYNKWACTQDDDYISQSDMNIISFIIEGYKATDRKVCTYEQAGQFLYAISNIKKKTDVTHEKLEDAIVIAMETEKVADTDVLRYAVGVLKNLAVA